MKKYQSLAQLMIVTLLTASCSLLQANNLSDAFERVDPSVVVIKTVGRVVSGEMKTLAHNSGVGTGFVVSKDGLIMTAAHVVNVADKIEVEFVNGDVISAKVVASSAPADVALIKLDEVPDDLRVASLADSDKVKIGQQVFVIGTPYGIEHTLTVGHVSAIREPDDEELMDMQWIQTDAAVNQGNSGGPLLSSSGEVIGVISHISSQSGGNEGLGFAVSINIAKRVLLEEKSYWSGVDMVPVQNRLAKALNVPQDVGMLVQYVASNSPGYTMGLRGGSVPVEIAGQAILLGGDIILAVEGLPVTSKPEDRQKIRDVINMLPDSELFEVSVLREGNVITLYGRR